MSGQSMLTDAIVYLGAAVLCVPIASRFQLGSVLGYLAAGCVIGPFGLRLVGDHEATLHFAEIGVVLMLFLIGLELDPKKLWTMRRSVFGGGGVQLAVCAAGLFVPLWLLDLPWQAALIASLALGLSSTAVAMQTMAEKNLLRTPVGQATFSVLLFQDIAAIPLLAVIPLLATGTEASGGGIEGALQAFGAIALVIVIGRFLTRPLLRIIASTGLREVFTAFTLLLVLGIAVLMARAGVSMALGAFLAGVLLASSEYRHALETDIEPFKGLLMGLFFIAVGMSIDFGLLGTRPWLMLSMVAAYQIIKGLLLRLVARGIGVDARSRWRFSALLAQGGEFAFVVFGVARTGGVLPGAWDRVLTLTVALSMALTPLLLWLERRAMRPAPSQTDRTDEIVDEGPHVIIAGFGRFGQIVGRLLFASGVKATVLDHDPDQIETLQRFGFRVYYGDATRIDLLEAAGASRAAALVNAIDDPDTSLRLIDAVREHFPNLTLLARARNVGHYYQLHTRGVSVIERETFESALVMGRKTLVALGVGAYEARERADKFRRQNIASIEHVFPHWHDEQRRREMARSSRQQLEEQMELDRAELDRIESLDWHDTSESKTTSSPDAQEHQTAPAELR